MTTFDNIVISDEFKLVFIYSLHKDPVFFNPIASSQDINLCSSLLTHYCSSSTLRSVVAVGDIQSSNRDVEKSVLNSPVCKCIPPSGV